MVTRAFCRVVVLATVIPLVGCAFAQHDDSIVPAGAKIVAAYDGTYACGQGVTAIELQVLDARKNGEQLAVFSFGPLASNPNVPNGSFLVSGRLDPAGGQLDLQPVGWITQPAFYSMVGLSGSSFDGGESFTGTVSAPLFGSLMCKPFSVHRIGRTGASS